MAVYISYYCQHCDAELVEDTSINSIGTTHVICNTCMCGNRTKSSPYSYKNTWGKIYTYIEAFGFKFLIFWCVPILIVVYLILNPLLDIENNTNNVYTIYTLSIVIAAFIRLYFLNKKIAYVEKRQKEIEEELGIEPV
jgi:hypothetical protein